MLWFSFFASAFTSCEEGIKSIKSVANMNSGTNAKFPDLLLISTLSCSAYWHDMSVYHSVCYQVESGGSPFDHTWPCSLGDSFLIWSWSPPTKSGILRPQPSPSQARSNLFTFESEQLAFDWCVMNL